MPYLENIPVESKSYGINKLLVVRNLSIDWKHRDTELFIRNSELLSFITSNYDLLKLLNRRSQQLRFIYHTSRSVLKHENPQDIVNYPTLQNQIDKIHEYSKVYFDFQILAKEGIGVYKSLDKTNLIVYSTKSSQRQIINYFIKHNIELPSKITHLGISDLLELNSNSLVSLIFRKNSLTEYHKKLLWSLNVYLYQAEKGMFKYISYKTDSKLVKPNMKKP